MAPAASRTSQSVRTFSLAHQSSKRGDAVGVAAGQLGCELNGTPQMRVCDEPERSGCGGRQGDAERGEQLRGERAGEAEGGAGGGDVFEHHVVHDDEVVEVRHQRGDLAAIGDDQQVIGEAVGVAVALDAALGIQHKAIVAGAFGQTLNVVGEHAIEPAHAVRAADGDLAAIAEIEGSCAFDEGGQLLGEDAEDGEAEGSGELLEATGSDAGAPPRACARAVGALTGAAWSGVW